MLVDLGVPAARRKALARRLKQAFDDLQETDSGWRYIDFDHLAWGRDAAETTAERIPGTVIIASDEPGDEADALVVVVGYADPFTGDVRLPDGSIVLAEDSFHHDHDEGTAGDDPSRLLPAVALFEEDGRLRALVGTVESTEEALFETTRIHDELATSIGNWVRDQAQTRQR